MPSMADKVLEMNERNARVQFRYDELTRVGQHGHYETLFRVVKQEVERERAKQTGTLARRVEIAEKAERAMAVERDAWKRRAEEAEAKLASLGVKLEA